MESPGADCMEGIALYYVREEVCTPYAIMNQEIGCAFWWEGGADCMGCDHKCYVRA